MNNPLCALGTELWSLWKSSKFSSPSSHLRSRSFLFLLCLFLSHLLLSLCHTPLKNLRHSHRLTSCLLCQNTPQYFLLVLLWQNTRSNSQIRKLLKMQGQGDVKSRARGACSLWHHLANTVHQGTKAPLGPLKGLQSHTHG